MRSVIKSNIIRVFADSEVGTDAIAIREFLAAHPGFVFVLLPGKEQVVLRALGPQETICRTPINVTSKAPDEQIRLIANFAETPFYLDGGWYGSVEGFWQSLKFREEKDRRRVAALAGSAAKRAGEDADVGDVIEYQGRSVRVGTYGQWALMRQACWAKFSQNPAAREALLGTGERPLEHRVRRDSKTIPGVIMADIWMKIRAKLAGS